MINEIHQRTNRSGESSSISRWNNSLSDYTYLTSHKYLTSHESRSNSELPIPFSLRVNTNFNFFCELPYNLRYCLFDIMVRPREKVNVHDLDKSLSVSIYND